MTDTTHNGLIKPYSHLEDKEENSHPHFTGEESEA